MVLKEVKCPCIEGCQKEVSKNPFKQKIQQINFSMINNMILNIS